MAKIKYKSAGIIIKNEKLLCAVGEEKNSEGKHYLLSPGGTISNDRIPTEDEKVEGLYRELKEELDLNRSDLLTMDFMFNCKAKAATVDMLLDMDNYMVMLSENAVIRPNFIEGNEDHDVFLAIWIGTEDLDYKEDSYSLKPNVKLDAVDKSGKEIKVNSSDFLFTAIASKHVIPELVSRKLL